MARLLDRYVWLRNNSAQTVGRLDTEYIHVTDTQTHTHTQISLDTHLLIHAISHTNTLTDIDAHTHTHTYADSLTNPHTRIAHSPLYWCLDKSDSYTNRCKCEIWNTIGGPPELRRRLAIVISRAIAGSQERLCSLKWSSPPL